MNHSTKSQLKWEKALEPALGMVGGITTILLFTNPFGWVALGVGAAISAVCTLIASFWRKSKEKERIKEAEEKLLPKIREVEEKLWKVTCDKNNEFFKSAISLLKDIRIQRMEKERQLYAAIDEVTYSPNDRATLIEDRAYLSSQLENY